MKIRDFRLANIKRFLVESHHSDPIAFHLEMVGSICAIIASGWLSVTADNPPLLWIYPFYLASSLLHTVASVRRNAAWIAILSIYFTAINIYGILNLTVF
jgi:hypothetical protein